jgi:hypothetical protein
MLRRVMRADRLRLQGLHDIKGAVKTEPKATHHRETALSRLRSYCPPQQGHQLCPFSATGNTAPRPPLCRKRGWPASTC